MKKDVILQRIQYNQSPCITMRRYFAIVLFVFIACAVWGQSATITGVVRDDKAKEPIIGASVLVVGSQGGTITDSDGRFSLNIPEGKCNLQISMIGYKTQTVDVCNKQDIAITLQEDTLLMDGVEVVGTRANTKIEGNALVTRIEGSALEEVGSLEEMLARTPGMQRNGENLEVIGKGEPEYYIDGRRIKEKVELKRLNSRQIDRVEVIMNPGAEYDGEMMAIVRIYTRRNFAQGISGDITGRYESSLDYLENIDPSVTANLRYRIKNVELKAGLNFWHASVTDISTSDQQSYTSKAGQSMMYKQQGSQDFRYRGYNLNYLFGVNWKVNERHTISLEAMLEQQLQDTTIVLSDNALSLNGIPVETLHTETHTRAFAPGAGVIGGWTNTQYIGHIGKSEIGAQFDTYNYRYTERNRIDESGQTMFSITNSESQQYNVKAYGAHPVWKGNLRVGTDMSFFHRYYTNDNNLSGIAGVNEDMYQHIYAAYMEYHLDMDTRGTLVAGLRYEHEYRRFDDHLKDSVFRARENYLFPSLSYHVKIKGVQLGLSYAMKTRRPEFTETNDATVYLNRYSLSQGNSRLETEVKHELSLQLRYRQLACGLNYEHRRRAVLTDVTLLNEGSTILFHPVNHDKPINQMSAFASYTPVWGIYHPNWTVSINAITHCSYQPVINLGIINPLMLKHAWQVELNYNLVTTGNPEWNKRLTTCSHNLTAAVQKSFLKDNALTLRLEARDILSLTKQNITTDYGYSIYQQQMRHDNRRVCLSLRYSL